MKLPIMTETNHRIATDIILHKIHELRERIDSPSEFHSLTNVFELDDEICVIPSEMFSQIMADLEKRKVVQGMSIVEKTTTLSVEERTILSFSADSIEELSEFRDLSYFYFTIPKLSRVEKAIVQLATTPPEEPKESRTEEATPQETPIETIEKQTTENLRKPFTQVVTGNGYLKFNKHGKGILIGGQNTRKFRLLQTLCNPEFGTRKTNESIFESIRLSGDSRDGKLQDFSLKKSRMDEIIRFTIKELQKIKRLQGKIFYKRNDMRTTLWIDLEG